MFAAPTSSPLPKDLAEAWHQRSLERERQSYRLGALIPLVFMPSRVIPDAVLEPQAWKFFAALRVVDALISALVFLGLARVRTLRGARTLCLIEAVSTGSAIAFMLPRVQHAQLQYVLGLSLVFWIAGVLLLWPLRYSVAAFGTILLSALAAYLLEGGLHDASVASGLYLVLVAVIATIGIHVRRSLERQAFTSTWELEQRNRELAAAVETVHRTQAQLIEAEKLSALGRLVAGVSHEINNPLAFVQADLRWIEEELGRQGKDQDGEIRKVVIEALEGSERIRQIIADLRAFAWRGAPERGETANIPRAVEEALRLASLRLRHVQEIRCDLAESLPNVFMNQRLLVQVLVNLLANAGDALRGEGTAGTPSQVVVRAVAGGEGVRVEVEDSGPGMNPEALGRLFEPFATTKPVGQGLGLGLSLSREYLLRYGGEIRGENLSGGGARFTLALRAESPGDSEPKTETKYEERALTG